MICKLCCDQGNYDGETCPDCYEHYCRLLKKSPLKWTEEEREYLFPGISREASLRVTTGDGHTGRLTGWERLTFDTVRKTVTWDDGTVETYLDRE